jgi:hypothetical protein
MTDHSPLSHSADDVPQVPKLQLVSEFDPYLETVPPPTRPKRLSDSTRLMLAGFLTIVGFLCGVAAQKHHDAGYLSPDQVARVVANSVPAAPANTGAVSEVPHTTIPNAQ